MVGELIFIFTIVDYLNFVLVSNSASTSVFLVEKIMYVLISLSHMENAQAIDLTATTQSLFLNLSELQEELLHL